jgi:hypothetical protein
MNFKKRKQWRLDLYRYLDKHGDDGDEFGEVFAALDMVVGPRGTMVSVKGASRGDEK